MSCVSRNRYSITCMFKKAGKLGMAETHVGNEFVE